MPERKIIFANRVYWPDESATAQLLSDLAPALAERGWPVHVITGGAGPAEHAGVTVHRTGGANGVRTTFERLRSYARFARGARRLLGDITNPGDVVVLKTDPPLLAGVATGIARARGALVCQWIQDIYPEILVAHKGRWLEPLLAPLRARRDAAWRQSARCVVVGGDMASTVAAAGVRESAIRVFPNWAPRELDRPAPPEEIAAIRADWKLSGKFVVAYSGNLGRVHEFDTIIAAASALQSKRAIAFAFIGHGPRIEHVRCAVMESALDNVHFFPPTPRARLLAALAAADVHLVTLRDGFESLVFPSKLAGVLASARPAVFVGAADCEIARLIREQRCGVSIATGNGASLAAALLTYFEQPDHAQQHRAAARATYEQHFRFNAAVDSWDRLVRALISGESRLP